MYSVLVVDDEVWVRKGIVQKLNAMGFGFDRVYEASSGEEALEAMRADAPNLVITDIRMDEMDGIELIKNAQSLYPLVKFVIVSGYGEFEYAEQAINMGVAGYILKPIKDDQFQRTIGKTLEEIDRMRESADLKARKDMLEKDSDAARQRTELFALLTSGAPAPGKGAADLPFGGCACFALAILNIDSSSYGRAENRYQDAVLIKADMKRQLAGLWERKNAFFMDNPADGNQILALFYGHTAEGLRVSAEKLAVDAYTKATAQLGIDMTVALSSIRDAVGPELLREAREAFDSRLVFGGNRILRHENLKARGKFTLPEHKLKLLQNCMEMRDFKNLDVILKDLFTIRDADAPAGAYVRFLYAETMNTLVKSGIKLGVDVGARIDAAALSGEAVDQFSTAPEIASYLLTTALNVLQAGTFAYNIDKSGLISKVNAYLESNYSKDVSVKSLSKLFAINPDYLSTLYRQETGETLIRRLTAIRMEKACALLRETAFSALEVAKCVGYEDPQYFFRVFKKVTGATPTEYRSAGA